MKNRDRLLISSLATGLIGFATAVPAMAASCDRVCLKGLADKVLASMVARDATTLPLSPVYAATENSAPSPPGMMVLWRTATAARGSYYVIDPVSEQVFVIATISEGPNDTLLYGRMKTQAGLISELELYSNRSRGQSGFMFSPDALANFPTAWTVAIAPERRATRAALLQAGRSIFDTKVKAPDIAPGCVLMENGRVVAEDAEVAKSVVTADTGGKVSAAASAPAAANPDGTVAIPCGNPPIRPTDKLARTDIIDEVQGVVVSLAIVHGVAEPYVITSPTESAFVPNSMRAPYEAMLKQQQATGKYPGAFVRPMPATQAVSQLHRIYDGKLQGMMMLQSTGAPGSRSPWVSR
jgi:hypothetical protein